MRKNLLILFLLTVYQLKAQQIPQFSQYVWNSYLINPAIGGAENFIEWKAGYRNQWVGIEGAPTTYYLTMHGKKKKKMMNREDVDVIHRTMHAKPPSKFARSIGFKKRKSPTAPASFQVRPHHGLGGQIMNDKIGIFNTMSIYGSYSYHIPLQREVYISMGAFVGIKQYRVDGSRATLTKASDNAIGPGLQGIVPDGMIGMMAYGNKFYVGASINHMFYNTFKLKNEAGNYLNAQQLTGHYFLMGGYRFKLNEDFAFVPSSMVRVFPGTPPSVDITAKLNYLDIIWAGASVRAKDAIILLAGVSYLNKYHFGYSYDLTTSNLRKFSSGTHEIIVGFRLINKPTKGCKPSYVW